MFGKNTKIKHDIGNLFIRLSINNLDMKNFISSLSFFNLKKNLNKNLKINSSIVIEKSVHYRRDLDSLG